MRSQALIAGTTHERGLLYRLDPSDRASRSSEEVLHLLAPGRYLVWWTLDEHRYADMLDDPSTLDEEGSVIDVQQYHPGRRAPLAQELEAFPADRYEVEIPAHHDYLRKLSAYSKPFAVLAESINQAIAVATVCDEHAKGKDKALATIDLTKGLVGILEGLPAALAALKPELDAPARSRKSYGRLHGFTAG